MHTLIDTYSSATVPVGQQVFPERCLLEDEDGIRALFIPDGPINSSDYQAAINNGSSWLIQHGPQIRYAFEGPLDNFVYDDETDTRLLDSRYWRTFHGEGLPTYYQAFEEAYAPRPGQHFVHLHTHSEFSALDGLSTPKEMARLAAEMGQPAMAITDHGTCSGQPVFQNECDKAGIKAIHGIELYFVDNRLEREPEHIHDYWHLILWAASDEGLRNLWGLSTATFGDGFYGKPRADWELLERYSEGLIASTGCLRGPVVDPYLKGDSDRAVANLGRLKAIFGDRLYAEIQTNQLADQIKANTWLVETAQIHGVPLVAACDSHYAAPEQRDAHRVWLSIQTNKDIADESILFQGEQDYSLASEMDVRVALAYLGSVADDAVANTQIIAEQCTARIQKRSHLPVYSRRSAEYPDPVEHDKERLYELCMQRWGERIAGKTHDEAAYLARFEHEFPLIIEKGFAGYFLIVWDIISHAKRNNVKVGAGRGSGGGCFVAYLLGIIEIDPVEYDILFERFMTKGRVELPDFDLDFPSSKKEFMFDYIGTRWGRDNMAIVGTHMRLKNKSIFKDVARALKSTLPEDYYLDIENICKIVDNAEADTAGLGLSYEALMVKVGEDFGPYRDKYPTIFHYADLLNHRLKTYGTHPAGIVIDTEAPLTENLPLRRGEHGMVTQFALEALESLGYVKFDLLNIKNLDIVQQCQDLIQENTGQDIDLYSFTGDELADPMVFEQISAGWTLGLFQINTRAGTRLCTQYKPANLVELAHVLTLVRPGPKNSGLTDLYLRRRLTAEEITYPDERLRPILGHTEGIMLFQEQLMQICLALANYTDEEADHVRKILGKKKIDQAKEEGRKFIGAAIDNGTDETVARQLWEQMEEFAKYCVSGDTRIHLAASGPSSDGTVTARELHHRLHSRLPAYSHPGQSDGSIGRPSGNFEGPCTCCGNTAQSYQRGYCTNKCHAWYQKFQAPQRGLFGLSYFADGRIRPARILDVVESGEQKLYRVTLQSGKCIDATADHRHLTPRGYRTVQELHVGDALLIDNGYDDARPTRRLTVGNRQEDGHVNHSFGDNNYGFVDGGHAIWAQWRRNNDRVCAQCDSTTNVQQAHLDGDETHNEASNYAWLCQPCHSRYDYAVNDRRRRWQKGHLSASDEIVGIEYVGTDMTYDVVMESPHNFVANGIVTHNSFGYAHAMCYALLSYWTGWLKAHYPLYFLCAALSEVKDEELPSFVEETRRMGYSVRPPDINLSGRGFTVDPANMAVRYGLESIKGVGGAAVEALLTNRPFTDWEDFTARKGKCNSGQVAILNQIGALESITGHRRWLEQKMALEAIPSSGACIHHSDTFDENDLPCSFDWTSLPPSIGKSGKLLKKQPGPPKQCSRACKQFRAREADPPELVDPYTDEDIRRIEDEILGVYLSSTPFDRLDPNDREECLTAEEVLIAEPGRYLVAGLIKTVKPYTDKSGGVMAFMDVATERGMLPITVFASLYAEVRHQLTPKSLCILLVKHDPRGQVLDEVINLDMMEDSDA